MSRLLLAQSSFFVFRFVGNKLGSSPQPGPRFLAWEDMHYKTMANNFVLEEQGKVGFLSSTNEQGKLQVPKEVRIGILKGRIISQLKCILKKTIQYWCTIINSFKQACGVRQCKSHIPSNRRTQLLRSIISKTPL
jgi:hypothetical protein